MRVNAVDAQAIARCERQAAVVLVEGQVEQARLVAGAGQRHAVLLLLLLLLVMMTMIGTVDS